MINELMQNPKARDIYINIPAETPPLILADNYISAKLDDDPDKCLAIEAHLRQAAQLNFQKPDVLEALKLMEKYKAMRKPGKGGSADLKMLARNIEENYTLGWFKTLDDNRIEFPIDGLKIRCANRPGAVALVAAKYRRGYRR